MVSGDVDKRLYRRVDVVIPFRAIPVERAAIDELGLETESRKQVKGSDDPMWAAMSRIERKVDRLLELLDENEVFRSIQPTSVNLSGAGVRFRSDIPLGLGIFLNIALILPGPLPDRIQVYGEVVRNKKLATPNGVMHETAVNFIRLPSSDRETIIRYTFQVETP